MAQARRATAPASNGDGLMIFKTAFFTALCLSLATGGASAESLSNLVSKTVRGGGDQHPLITTPALAPTAAAAKPIVPGDPFAAWIVPADSGMSGVIRAGARGVNPGADTTPLGFADRLGLFMPHEEWALWATDAVINLGRARALDAALNTIARSARRAGAPKDALAEDRRWVDALKAGAAERFRATFDRRAPKRLRWPALDDVAALQPRTAGSAINLALGAAPALQRTPQIGAPEASYSRMQLQRASGLTPISTDRAGPVGADGISVGVKLHVGIVPGGLNSAVAGAAAEERNRAKRNISERIMAAFDARRAADAHAPIQKHRIRRFDAALKGHRGKDDPAAAADAAYSLWTETAAEINARHA
ncbi:MAG: hypothetical protein AAF684_07095, partial [Pseudomonadota bacterium]